MRKVIVGLILCALAVSLQCFAQGMDPAKFTSVQKENAQALRQYTWKQRVELQLKGETKKVSLSMLRYDAQGQEQKTLLSEEPQPQPPAPPSGKKGGRLKAKIVENKKEDFKEMMEGLVTLVKSYSQIPPDKLKEAMAGAEKIPGEGDMQEAIGLHLTNIVQPEDSLTIWIDMESMLFRRIEIASSYDKEPVTAVADYKQLARGPNTMAQAVLQYPSKNLLVKIDNFDYQLSQ